MKTCKLTLVLFFLIILSSTAFAQIQIGDESDENLRMFGFGIHVEQFNLQDLSMSTEPVTKIMLIVTPFNYLRGELEFGFAKNEGETEDMDFSSKSSSVGLGILAMQQFSKTNVYGGLRLNQSKSKSDRENGFGDYEMDSKMTSYGPVIGVEYFFNSHFSFGGEFGFNFYTYEAEEDYGSGPEDTKSKGTNTRSGLIVRFYL